MSTDSDGGSKPRLLDLFCGAGGAAMGYHRAGFEVVGVDIKPQPNYPFAFIEADALEYMGNWSIWRDSDVVAIHASPPCQFATAYKRTGNVKESPNLIPTVRAQLEVTGLPYVIENVESARDELHEPTLICGTMFDPPMEIQRHRLFETNWLLCNPQWPCRHKLNGKDRYPGGRSKQRTGSSRGLVRATIEIGSWDIPLDVQQRAMGIYWMSLEELSEAIPPFFTAFIGAQLRARLSEAPDEESGDAEDAFTRLKRVERIARHIGNYDLTSAVMLTDIRELHEALAAYREGESGL